MEGFLQHHMPPQCKTFLSCFWDQDLAYLIRINLVIVHFCNGPRRVVQVLSLIAHCLEPGRWGPLLFPGREKSHRTGRNWAISQWSLTKSHASCLGSNVNSGTLSGADYLIVKRLLIIVLTSFKSFPLLCMIRVRLQTSWNPYSIQWMKMQLHTGARKAGVCGLFSGDQPLQSPWGRWSMTVSLIVKTTSGYVMSGDLAQGSYSWSKNKA